MSVFRKLLLATTAAAMRASSEAVIGAACYESPGATCDAGASLSLLQRAAGSAKAQIAAETSSVTGRAMRLLQSVRLAEAGRVGAVNCSQTPALCSELLRCDQEPVTAAESARMMVQVTTADGHANLRTWCAPIGAGFDKSVVQHCLVNHDLKTSAQESYKLQVSKGIGEYDGSYCFQEHCHDTEVTYNTTLEEAETLCDKRYPGWRSFGLKAFGYGTGVATLTDYLPRANPGLSKLSAQAFGTLACAMGNYHCDVIYCRDTYCQMEHYQRRFAHLAPKPRELPEQP